jgi:molybdopterin-guanine dinucleotide biosynthesis protein B
MSLPVFGIVGWKNSGKTTLMEKLIAEFSTRGLRVAAVKHAHHSFDLDYEGRDTYRFRQAGASQIAVSSPVRFAVMTELNGGPEPSLDTLLARLSAADIILVEGFKASRHPKLEVRRKESIRDTPLAEYDDGIKAIAADFEIDSQGLPLFRLDDTQTIADFIASHLRLPIRERQAS